MRMNGVVPFLLSILVVYVGVNYFLFAQSKPLFMASTYSWALKIIFFLLALSFPLGMLLEHNSGGRLAGVIGSIGTFWLAVMLYLSIIFIFILLLRLTNRWLDFSDFLDFRQHANYHIIAVEVAYVLLATVLVVGHINAIKPKEVVLNIAIEKNVNSNLRIVAVSDIHLGSIVGKRALARLVRQINAQNPDVVLLVGDTFDHNVEPVVRQNLGAQFGDIKAKYGIFAVPGNHDYFGLFEQKIQYLRNSGIVVLCDSVAKIGDYYIVGRNDKQSEQAISRKRASVENLVSPLDSSKVIVLLDHQPFRLGEAQDAGVDLQLSGHTHNGQMWPFNLVTGSIFELSHGYLQRGNTHYYVSSGYGTWGPRVRIGSRAELVVVNLSPKNSK